MPEEESRTGPRVLVVDDDSAVRAALRRYLARSGWEVEEAGTGEEGLRLLLSPERTGGYDAVICDLRLPGISGAEVCRRITAERPELAPRLLLVTGDPDAREVEEVRGGTPCPVMEKPFEMTDLVRRLSELRGR